MSFGFSGEAKKIFDLSLLTEKKKRSEQPEEKNLARVALKKN